MKPQETTKIRPAGRRPTGSFLYDYSLLDYVCYIRYYFPLDREKDDFLLGSWLMSSNTRNLRLSFHQ